MTTSSVGAFDSIQIRPETDLVEEEDPSGADSPEEE